MKKKILAVVLGVVSVAAFAQSTSTSADAKSTIKLRGTRLTYPIVRKWASEFSAKYPNITIEVGSKVSADSIDLEVVAFQFDKSRLTGEKQSLILNRYAQVPIANCQRPNLANLQAKGFTDGDFKKVYFSTEPGQVAVGKSPITVYKREKPACAAISFANHYSSNPNSTSGIGISGDDSDLSKAVKRDVNGLSYNNLGFIYNTKTRKVADSLAVIPLDLNENGKVDADEQIYATLDEVLNFIEKTNSPKFVTDGVNVIFKKDNPNPNVKLFINWILTEGQQYNHEFGFLNHVNEITLAEQKEKLAFVGDTKESVKSCDGIDKALQKRKNKQKVQ